MLIIQEQIGHVLKNENLNENSVAEYNEISNAITIYSHNTQNIYYSYIRIARENKFSNFSICDLVNFSLDHELIHYDITKNAKLDEKHRSYVEYYVLSEAIANYRQYIENREDDKVKFDILRCRILSLIETIKYINKSTELYDGFKKPKPIVNGFGLHKEYLDETIINFYGGLMGCQIAYNEVKDMWNNELSNFSRKDSILAKYLDRFSKYILDVVKGHEEINDKLLSEMQKTNEAFIRENKLLCCQ